MNALRVFPRRTPYRTTIASSMLLLLLAWPWAVSAQPAPGGTLTLTQALAEAFERHPQLAKLQAAVAVQDAFLRAAGVYPFNPELSLSANARLGDATTADFEVGIAQEFEIAGQRRRRQGVAHADADVAHYVLQRTLQSIGAQVRWAFVDAVAQRELVEIARAELELSAQLVELTKRRMDAGAGTLLEVAVARAELSKTEEQFNATSGEYAIARAELGYVIGLGPAALPEPVGAVAQEEPPLTMSLDELMAAARANREDLVALRKTEIAARRRIELARAEAWPNLTIGAFVGQEAGSEVLVGGRLTVPIPLFERNQGGIAIAQAAELDAQADTVMAEQAVLRDVATAYQQYVAAERSLENLRNNLVGTEEALGLLRRSFEAGKITWVEILVMRRALFDARRALVKVTAGGHRTRIKLDVATGTLHPPAPPTAERP